MRDVLLVTGEINSGKTAKMRELYKASDSGSGFLSVKIFDNSIHTGYDLLFLPDNYSMPFIRKKEYMNGNEKTVFKTGKYIFLKKAFDEAEKIINRNIINNNYTVYIDELGPLELEKKCFYKSALKVINSNIPLIASVRSSCLSGIIKLFKISRYRIIEV
jgi:nucleoside-triphosphatase THEP1